MYDDSPISPYTGGYSTQSRFTLHRQVDFEYFITGGISKFHRIKGGLFKKQQINVKFSIRGITNCFNLNSKRIRVNNVIRD